MNVLRQLLPRFVVFEGLDGAGTTTQSRMLHDRLVAHGRDVWLTSEPTSRPLGLVARDILSGSYVVSPRSVAYTFAADRCDHLESEGGIRDHIGRGDIVICDRYRLSSLAYQSVDADPGLVASLNAAFDDPELLVFLDLPPEAMEERLAGRPKRDIYERIEFQARVRERYLAELALIDSGTRILMIDATLKQEPIAEKIWETLGETSILKT